MTVRAADRLRVLGVRSRHGIGIGCLTRIGHAGDDAVLLVRGHVVLLANSPARTLLGDRIEGRDVRLAIRHPQALEQILAARPSDIDVTGLVEPGRSWRIAVRKFDETSVLVRMVDRSAAVSAEKMRVDFGLERDRSRRFALWSLLYMLGASPDLDVAFKDAADRDLARDFMAMAERAQAEEP